MPLKLSISNSPPMDGWKYEIKLDGWWLMKTKIMLQNQTYNYSKDIYQIYWLEHSKNQTNKQKKTDSETQKLANI